MRVALIFIIGQSLILGFVLGCWYAKKYASTPAFNSPPKIQMRYQYV